MHVWICYPSENHYGWHEGGLLANWCDRHGVGWRGASADMLLHIIGELWNKDYIPQQGPFAGQGVPWHIEPPTVLVAPLPLNNPSYRLCQTLKDMYAQLDMKITILGWQPSILTHALADMLRLSRMQTRIGE